MRPRTCNGETISASRWVDKIFALLSLSTVPPRLMFKCAPEKFAELVEQEDIIPAPYVGRYKWVSFQRLDVLPWIELKDLIGQSCAMVVAKARIASPKNVRPKLTGGPGRVVLGSTNNGDVAPSLTMSPPVNNRALRKPTCSVRLRRRQIHGGESV